MNKEEIISSGLLEQYALGQCSAEEELQVEQWLKQSPEVKAAYEAIELTMEQYAFAHAKNPSETVKLQLLAKLAKQQHTPATKAPARLVVMYRIWKIAAAASVVLFIGSSVMNYIFYTKYQKATRELVAVNKEIKQMQEMSKELEQDMSIVSKGVPISLKGMDIMPAAKATIFWVQETHDVFIDASKLPTPPPGMQYQFWGIIDGKPVDGGMIFTPESGKKMRLQKMKSFGRAEAFAVSLEKSGGSPTPTTVVSIGKII